MKSQNRFILFILIFLGVMFTIEYNLPKKFVWKPTFARFDKQPLGCFVLDSLLSSSLPNGYGVVHKTLYQIHQEDSIHKKGLLILSTDLNFSPLEIKILLKMANKGNKIMLVSNQFNQGLSDTLNFYCSSSYFDLRIIKAQLAENLMERDTIYWVGDSTVYSNRFFTFYSSFCGSDFLGYDSIPARTLMQKDRQKNINYDIAPLQKDAYRNYHPGTAFIRTLGQGEIILVSSPLLFTNYGILDNEGRDYVFRLLSQMGDLPIVRTEAYMKNGKDMSAQQSPFRYFLSKPPLRWALYSTIAGILLFMFFTAKRKQRIIPVVSTPENKSLEFTELIGTLYFQKKDHADLVRKKFIYFSEIMRKEVQVDLENQTDQERMFYRMSKKTGIEQEELRTFFQELNTALSGGSSLTSKQMKYYIDKMNEIINQI